ncbi:MAG: UDP-N-acetylglucosamine pyrophosphorylase [Eubacteriales bacterium]|nr:UDP-N-acetylglucosamine pyrophosphorylase [Eubacteriales bacterium]
MQTRKMIQERSDSRGLVLDFCTLQHAPFHDSEAVQALLEKSLPELLADLSTLIRNLIPHLGPDYRKMGEEIYVHESARISEAIDIHGPCILGPGTEVRPHCFIRGSVLTGENVLLGHCCEFKNVLLFDGAQVPHLSYVGDAILGHRAHLGAAVILSNFRADHGAIHPGREHGYPGFPEQMRKFSALVGDDVEIGASAVINPGSLLAPRSCVAPLSSFRGILSEDELHLATGERRMR